MNEYLKAVSENARPRKAKSSRKFKKSEETRKKILDAAADCLNHEGYALISMQTIADRINIKAASIYYYFSTKDELVDEVLRIGILVVHEDVRNAVEELGNGATCREKLEAAIRAHLLALLNYGDYTSANIRNFSLVPFELRKNNSMVRRNYANYWRGLLDQGKRAGEIRPDADTTLFRLFLIGALNWSTDWYNPRKESVDHITKEIARIFFDGAMTPSPTESLS